MTYSKTCFKWPLKKKTKTDFQDQLSLTAGQKVLQNAPKEHSAILSTFIKLPFVFKTLVLYIFEWPLKTGFTLIKDFKLFSDSISQINCHKFLIISNQMSIYNSKCIDLQ